MPPLQRRSILILAHPAGSFLEPLVAQVRARGLSAHVLAPRSRVLREDTERFQRACDRLFVSEAGKLVWSDVTRVLDVLRAEGEEPQACLTIWEGDRLLMARANDALHAVDASCPMLERTMDKLSMRRLLHAAGLSRVRSFEVETQAQLEHVQALAQPLFLKPRRGIASFAASRLDRSLSWSRFQERRRSLVEDPDCDIFTSDAPFVAEDYVPGDEFSVEVIVHEAEVYPLAIHEKWEMAEQHGTVLEIGLRSPPRNLGAGERQIVASLLAQVFRTLDLRCGCYHVELKHDPARRHWEIIEVNVRIGGSYIVQSTEAVSGENLLQLWLATLLPESKTDAQLVGRLENARSRFLAGKERMASAFRGYYGVPGRVVASATWAGSGLEPTHCAVFTKPGTRLANAEREIVVGHAFWSFALDGTENEVFARIERESPHALRVVYAGPEMADPSSATAGSRE